MIIIRNRKLLIPNDDRYLGTTYDNNSVVRQFRVERYTQNETDLAGLSFKADLRYEDGTTDTMEMDREEAADHVMLSAVFPTPVMSHAGTLLLSIRGYSGDGGVKWASFFGAFYVEERDGITAGQGQLTELEQLEQRVNAAIKAAEEKTAAAVQEAKAKTAEAINSAREQVAERLSALPPEVKELANAAVAEWVAQQGGVIHSVQIDKSLSVEWAAAEAKTVGEALSTVNENASKNRDDLTIEINKKVTSSGGESGKTVVTLPPVSSGINSLTAAVSKIVTGGRLGQLIADIKAGLGYVLHVGQLVNNCVSNSETLPLAARQGKVLQDQINTLNAKIEMKILRGPITKENSMFFYLANPTMLGSKTIPAHTRGVYVGGNGSGSLMCVDINGDFYAGFQYDGTWMWKM